MGSKIFKKLFKPFFLLVDQIFLKHDKSKVLRSRNILKIPTLNYRKGGKFSYAEWSHVIGVLQTLIQHNTEEMDSIDALDVGCGTGLVGIALEPIVQQNGTYEGLDVINKDIEFCRKNFENNLNYSFRHFDLANPTYASHQSEEFKPWPIESSSKDLITALSVWTHLKEEDAVYYFKEISRVLRKNGKAMISFFILDDRYDESLTKKDGEIGAFYNTPKDKWIFDTPAYGSSMWFTPKWVRYPEDAIGVNKEGLELLLKESQLKLSKHYQGRWKEQKGVYFQDILIFEKI